MFSDIFNEYKEVAHISDELQSPLEDKTINQSESNMIAVLDQLDIAIQSNNSIPYSEIASSLENLYNETGNSDFWFYSAYINDIYANNAEKSIQDYISFYNNSSSSFKSRDYVANRLSELYYMLTKQLGHYNINKLIIDTVQNKTGAKIRS